jgi:hypothetical protein
VVKPNTEEKVVLNEFKVLSSKFFKNNFDDAEVYLNNIGPFLGLG